MRHAILTKRPDPPPPTLQRCPFCGGPGAMALAQEGPDPYVYVYVVRCRVCKATAGWMATASAAERMWNQRAAGPEKEPT